jgi:hypothetical protein
MSDFAFLIGSYTGFHITHLSVCVVCDDEVMNSYTGVQVVCDVVCDGGRGQHGPHH